ncbi:MAG: DUF4892 domain-containing protein [Rhizobiaceae bacterium]|nr:DUF4892 domain-containing protein [Rhizobiaceae bacterium]
MKPLRAALLVLCVTGASQALAEDIPGSSDHPAIGRYEGASISYFQTKAYDEIRLPSGPLQRGDRDNPSAWQIELAGKVTSIGYEGPAGRSILEVMRNYEETLKASGFKVNFLCRGEEQCSPGRMIPTFWEAARSGIRIPQQWDSTVYLLAERHDSSGPVTVAMIGVETKARGDRRLMPHVAVTVVEGQPMETDKITVVPADEIEQALVRDGRIAIYGIYFDFDQSEVKPESRPQIEQLAALLKKRPDLTVLVVGHTDGQGEFDYNLSLSQKRAQAVADLLVSEFEIGASRVTPAGAGMMAPVTTNRTEEGRAKNRRVEIVELSGG